MAPNKCVYGVRHKRLGVVKGVGRRASPRRLKNIALNHQIRFKPASHKPKPKTVVKAHSIHIILDGACLIYWYKFF